MSSISETSIICAKYLSEECINFSLLWEPLPTSSLPMSILFSMNNNLYLGRNLSADIICSKKQFSEIVAQGELWALRNRLCPRTNIGAYFCAKWRLLCLLSFKLFFSQHAQFWKLGSQKIWRITIKNNALIFRPLSPTNTDNFQTTKKRNWGETSEAEKSTSSGKYCRFTVH